MVKLFGVSVQKDPALDYNRIKQCLGMDNSEYRQFVLSGIAKPIDPFKNTYAGFLLGSAQFIKEKLESLKDQTKESQEIAYRDIISEGIDIELITQEVGERYHKETGGIVCCQEKAGFRQESRYLPG